MPSNGKAGSLSAPAGGEMLTRGRRTWATGQIAGATALAAAVFVTAFACILLRLRDEIREALPPGRRGHGARGVLLAEPRTVEVSVPRKSAVVTKT